MTAFIDRFRRVCGSAALGWLLIANCSVFFLLWIVVMVGNYFGVDGNFTIRWFCVSSSSSLAVSHIWTALTYMMVHYDFLHLLFNILWLFWFGKILVTVCADCRLPVFYLGGGIAGAVLYVAVNALFPGVSSPGGYLCGASASVLSIMAGAAFFAPDMRLYLFIFGEVRLKWVAIGCILLTFAGIGGGNAGGQAAHVGGVVFGILYALVCRVSSSSGESCHEPRAGKGAAVKDVTPPRRRNVMRDGNAVARAVSGKLSDANRLDALLDKIRLSGYSSLTENERKELNALSQRLQND